jgi:hypothetical protein
MFLDLIVFLITFTLVSEGDEDMDGGKLKVWFGIIYSMAQMCAWWYHVGEGLHCPHFVPWLNPSAWIISWILLCEHYACCKIMFTCFFAPFVAVQLVLSLYIVFV